MTGQEVQPRLGNSNFGVRWQRSRSEDVCRRFHWSNERGASDWFDVTVDFMGEIWRDKATIAPLCAAGFPSKAVLYCVLNNSPERPKDMSKKSKQPRIRKVRLNSDAISALAQQRQAFRARFGREPGPDDPVFFDPNASSPQPLPLGAAEAQIAIAMERMGADPAIVYAFKKTGVLLTDANYYSVSSADRAAYDAAIDEYERGTKST